MTCLEACLNLVMCLGARVMSTNLRFVFIFNKVMCLKACFILVMCLEAHFGDVLGSSSDVNKPMVCNLVMLMKHNLF